MWVRHTAVVVTVVAGSRAGAALSRSGPGPARRLPRATQVAAAAGVVDIGLGTDTGGSIRIPAAFCGVLGIRPTWGRISQRHASALAPSFTTAGWWGEAGSKGPAARACHPCPSYTPFQGYGLCTALPWPAAGSPRGRPAPAPAAACRHRRHSLSPCTHASAAWSSAAPKRPRVRPQVHTRRAHAARRGVCAVGDRGPGAAAPRPLAHIARRV